MNGSINCCPGCGCTSFGAPLRLEAQPVILNYRFSTPDEASSVLRRPLELLQCQHCGLVFNALLEIDAVPYDERYENRQSGSAVFREMMLEAASGLAQDYHLENGHIMEVGCGKGEFLKMVCEAANATGVGFDTTCEEGALETGPVKFYRRYATAADAATRVDAVVCRHVIEHVPQVSEFLELLHSISDAGDAKVVYLETPVWEWIVEKKAFWDVFYEHCNYFPAQTLRYLSEKAGFEVIRQKLIFGGQYQVLEMRPRRLGVVETAVAAIGPSQSLERFSHDIEVSRNHVKLRILETALPGAWALWGAGAKGVSLVNTLLDLKPAFVVDMNPAKQGTYIPGTTVRVVGADDPRLQEITSLLVANSNYVDEIRRTLTDRGLHPILVPL